jgi:hypothetical protein
MVEVSMGKNDSVQLPGRNMDGKAHFMVYHDPVVHKDLANRCFYRHSGSTHLLACSKET